MRPVAAALLALLLAACSAVGGVREFRAGDVTVRDETGLVKAAELIDLPVASLPAGPVVASGESLSDIIVSWSGNSCVPDWTVGLSGYALIITIVPGEAPDGCLGTEASHYLLLDLNRVVQADGIEISMQTEP